MSLPTPEDIRRMRIMAGLTQKELAERAGVSQSLIARIEAGTVDPRLSTLRKILKALIPSIGDLKAEQVMHKPVIWVDADEPVRNVVELMEKYGISQIPVLDKGNVVGTIHESTLLRHFLKTKNPSLLFNKQAREVMDEPLPMVSSFTSISDVLALLGGEKPAVLVVNGGKLVGIITKIDIISAIKPRSRGLHDLDQGKA
ncbi:MAG: CBS domain-containing protein [Candidatus Nezhaarchaeales archaeon]|nr:MAG: transcriptional regulator [Candidatus Nezhaarchaeota archaeon WYZ-LMO8]TDA36545.1 MAG: transcriptional regulator [Candidatus Nezhaarchaeota archaeon WYZ-LMO7]